MASAKVGCLGADKGVVKKVGEAGCEEYNNGDLGETNRDVSMRLSCVFPKAVRLDCGVSCRGLKRSSPGDSDKDDDWLTLCIADKGLGL